MDSARNPIRPKTVKLVTQLLKPLVDEGVVTVAEFTELQAQLKSLAAKGTLLSSSKPQLLTMQDVADRLKISLALFKRLERDGELPGLSRRMVGRSAVRYRSHDVARYIMTSDDAGQEQVTSPA
jgi:predicted DNA-binding transcriptional regulator AlpA